METSEAMAVLGRAGRGDEAAQIVEAATDAAQARYREIEADETRTPEFRSEETKRVYDEQMEELNTRLVGLAQNAVRSEQGDAVRAFGVADLPGDSASLVISRRDAVDRVSSVEGTDQLMELLERANRGGDEVLARAVAERAMEKLDDKVLHAFLADRPKLDSTVERLWSVAQSSRSYGNKLAHTMLLASMRPQQMAGR